MREKQYKKSLEYKQKVKTSQQIKEKYERFKKEWVGMVLSGNYLTGVKDRLICEINQRVELVKKKLCAKKILRIWRKVRVEKKIAGMSERLKRTLREFFIKIKKKIIVMKFSGRSLRFTRLASKRGQSEADYLDNLRKIKAANKILRALVFFKK